MKILQVIALIIGLTVLVNAQSAKKTTVLTGTVYDAQGAVIVNSKVTAVDQKGEKFEAFTNEDGVFSLSLPYKEYQPTSVNFRIAKYDITVEANGFEKFILKDFRIIGGYSEKMQLDFALDVLVMVNPITVPIKQ